MDIPHFFKPNQPLSELCTFGIGGPCRYLVVASSIERMRQSFAVCQREGLPFFILGKGSNCLFDDRGFDGVVILNKITFFEEPEPAVFHVGGGFSFSLLGVQTARKGWSGLEFASGIPGTVGGAVFMNAGANGNETANSLVSVDFLTPQGELKVLPRQELEFGNRRSSFQKIKGAVVGATFKLTPSAEAREKQIAFIHYRMQTQPYREKSAGCMFVNPSTGIGAGALIDRAGLKGMRVGDAQVSSLHANFILNIGKAHASDVEQLVAEIKRKVKEQTGIELIEEVRKIPFQFQEG